MIALEGNRLLVGGSLTMNTVPEFFAEGLQYLNRDKLVLDFSQVEIVDSSAVSLLLGWLRVAQQNKRELRVANLPASLVSLAGLYGVTDLLPSQEV